VGEGVGLCVGDGVGAGVGAMHTDMLFTEHERALLCPS
jgi:hypothetical protein